MNLDFQKNTKEELIKIQYKLRISLAGFRNDLKFYKKTGILPTSIQLEEEKKAVRFLEDNIINLETACNLIKIELDNMFN